MCDLVQLRCSRKLVKIIFAEFSNKKKNLKIFSSPSAQVGGILKCVAKLVPKVLGVEEGRHKFTYE